MTRLRISVLVALAVLVAALPSPAAAHAVVTPFEIEVNREVTINFQVIGDLPVDTVAVELQIPPEFEVGDVAPLPGWAVENEAGAIKATGSMISGSYMVLSVTGRSTKKGELRFPLIETGTDGSTLAFTEGGFGGLSAPVVFSGIKYEPPSGTPSPDAGSGGSSIPVIAVAAAAFAALLVALWRRTRRPVSLGEE